MNENMRNDIITLLKAGYTKEEIKEMYKPEAPAADPAPAASPDPGAKPAADPAPAASPKAGTDVNNASFNLDALNKAFDGFITNFNKTIEKINIQNSQIGANPEQSIEQMLANVVMPNPGNKKGE